MTCQIKIYTNHEDDFYTIMGPFFANRKYAQEMGGWQFYTKEQTTWFVAFINNKVAGFCAAIHEPTHIYFDNFYVLQPYRGQGISNQLSNTRFNYAKQQNKEIRVISNNPIQFRKYIRNGFIEHGHRGRYTKFKWSANTHPPTCQNTILSTKPLEP